MRRLSQEMGPPLHNHCRHCLPAGATHPATLSFRDHTAQHACCCSGQCNVEQFAIWGAAALNDALYYNLPNRHQAKKRPELVFAVQSLFGKFGPVRLCAPDSLIHLGQLGKHTVISRSQPSKSDSETALIQWEKALRRCETARQYHLLLHR